MHLSGWRAWVPGRTAWRPACTSDHEHHRQEAPQGLHHQRRDRGEPLRLAPAVADRPHPEGHALPPASASAPQPGPRGRADDTGERALDRPDRRHGERDGVRVPRALRGRRRRGEAGAGAAEEDRGLSPGRREPGPGSRPDVGLDTDWRRDRWRWRPGLGDPRRPWESAHGASSERDPASSALSRRAPWKRSCPRGDAFHRIQRASCGTRR